MAPQTAPPAADRDVPLAVDLDGTLVATDVATEGFAGLLFRSPLAALRVLPAILRGRPAAKRAFAEAAPLDAAALPYREEFLAWLREEKGKGRRLVLATAADAANAKAVADHLGLFDEVMACDGVSNLKGKDKRRALEARFGPKGFDYAGDHPVDLEVWAGARKAVVVGARPGLAEAAAATCPVERVFPRPVPAATAFVRALRPRQWMKNLLVLVPVMTAHALVDRQALVAALLAVVVLSLAASGVYLANDLADLPSDRRHREKRHRPLAAGDLLPQVALAAVPLLVGGALALSALLPVPARILLLVYLLTTTLYTAALKRRVLVDVFVLSLLYTLRVFFGSAATGIPSSPWLLAFAIFVFLSLAFAKRGSELANLRLSGGQSAPGRGWSVSDEVTVAVSGVSSAYAGGIVLALYVHADETRRLYAHPGWLWLLVPMLLYWANRVWIKVGRGEMTEDPIVFASRDRITWFCAVATGIVLLLAARAPVGIPGLME